MKLKVGNRVVIFSDTIYIPDGEASELQYQIAEGDILNCRFRFQQNVNDETYGTQPHITTHFQDEWFDISFCNFTQSLGSTTPNPINFGRSNKQEALSFLAGIYKLQGIGKLEIQIMMEELS